MTRILFIKRNRVDEHNDILPIASIVANRPVVDVARNVYFVLFASRYCIFMVCS